MASASELDGLTSTHAEGDIPVSNALDRQDGSLGKKVRFGAVAAVVSVVVVTGGIALMKQEGVLEANNRATSDLWQTRTGCSNWVDIMLANKTTSSLEECRQKCQATMGCIQFNYAPGKCGLDPSTEPMSCFLFAEGCDQKAHTCWDLYNNTASPQEAHILNASRTGCSNWNSSLIQDYTKALTGINVHQCAQECQRNTICRQFGYQATKCHDSDGWPAGKSVGACYLYQEECDRKGNDCWDLYDKTAGTVHEVKHEVSIKADASSKSNVEDALKDTVKKHTGQAPKVQTKTSRRLSDSVGRSLQSMSTFSIISVLTYVTESKAQQAVDSLTNATKNGLFTTDLHNNLNGRGVAHDLSTFTSSEPQTSSRSCTVREHSEAQTLEAQGTPTTTQPAKNAVTEVRQTQSLEVSDRCAMAKDESFKRNYEKSLAKKNGVPPSAVEATPEKLSNCARVLDEDRAAFAERRLALEPLVITVVITVTQDSGIDVGKLEDSVAALDVAALQSVLEEVIQAVAKETSKTYLATAKEVQKPVAWRGTVTTTAAAPAAADTPAPTDPAEQEAAKQEAAKQEAAKQEAAKQEAAKQEAAKQEEAKQEAAKQEEAKQEAAKQEEAKQEEAKQEGPTDAAESPGVLPGASQDCINPDKSVNWCCPANWIADGDGSEADAEEWTMIHNVYRCMHGSQFNKWSGALSKKIGDYVATLPSCSAGDWGACLKHDNNKGAVGENLAGSSVTGMGPEGANLGWYSEVESCDLPGCGGGQNGPQPKSGNEDCMVGHFTAMVWKGGATIGCAGSGSSNGVSGCRYEPTTSNDQPNLAIGPNYADNYNNNVVAATTEFAACKTKVETCFGKTLSTAFVYPPADKTFEVSTGSCRWK